MTLSRRLHTLICLACIAIVFPNCVRGEDWIYTVRPGDNLWTISEKFLERGTADVNKLREHNRLNERARLRPGRRLRIPIPLLNATPASAELIVVIGEVGLQRRGTNAPQAGLKGAELHFGDRLVTGQQGSAVVRFADGSTMLVQSSSDVSFDAMGVFGDTGMADTSMRLNAGRLETRVPKLNAAATRFEVTTPPAVAAVRGTSFRIGYAPGEATMRAEVTEGGVAVQGAGGDGISLAKGFGTLTKTGEPPAPPIELLPAPELSNVGTPLEKMVGEVTWPKLAGAVAYRVQLLSLTKPTQLVLDQRVSDSRTAFEVPPDANYRLRVRGIDHDGLEGLNGDIVVTVNARPEPPLPMSPPTSAKRHGKTPEFRWGRRDDIAGYHLQIARDEHFQQLLVDERGLSHAVHQPDVTLAPGEYFWRISVFDAAGERGPFGDALPLTMLAEPPAPGTPGASPEGDDAARLAWPAALHAVHYEYQLALDSEFTDQVVDGKVDQTNILLEGLKPSTSYAFRVRGVTAEGVKGPYSAANVFDTPDGPWWPSLIILLPLLAL